MQELRTIWRTQGPLVSSAVSVMEDVKAKLQGSPTEKKLLESIDAALPKLKPKDKISEEFILPMHLAAWDTCFQVLITECSVHC